MKKKIPKSLTAAFCALLAALVMLPAFAACNREGGNADEIVVGTTSEIIRAVRDEYNFDMLASGVSEMPLVAKSTEGEFSPLLASFSTEDGVSWTYTVCDGMKWSDGKDVTARDIVFSLEYEAAEEGGEAFGDDPAKSDYASYSLSEDGRSVTLVRHAADVKALEEMAGFRIRPEHIYAGKSADEITEADARVTCGPYKLQSFDKAAGAIVFTVNEHYPEIPAFKKVTYRLFGSEEVMYAALLGGELDYVWNYSTGVPASYRAALEKADGVTLESVPSVNCPAMLVFNNSKGLFADKDLRFAVSYALDYNAFREYFGSAYSETPDRSFPSSACMGYKPTEKLVTDLEKAAEHMRAAGYEKRDGRWMKEGAQAAFGLTVNAGKPTHVGYAEFVKTQLEKFGISVTLDTVDAATYNAKTSNKYAGESGGRVSMEAAIMGFTAYGMSDLGGMYIDGTHPVQGGAQVFDEELTAILDDMESAETLAGYEEAAGRLQDYYAANTPAIALLRDSLVYARSSSLTGVTVDGTFGLNNVANWFSMKKTK